MSLMGIVTMIVVGFVVGLIARAIVPGVDALGFWLTTLLGVAGSVVGGIIGNVLSRSDDGRFKPAGNRLFARRRHSRFWSFGRLTGVLLEGKKMLPCPPAT